MNSRKLMYADVNSIKHDVILCSCNRIWYLSKDFGLPCIVYFPFNNSDECLNVAVTAHGWRLWMLI